MRYILNYEFSCKGKIELGTPPCRMGDFSVEVTGEDKDMLIFRVKIPKLPEGNPENVVRETITVEVDGVQVSSGEITDFNQEYIEGLKGPQDSLVVCTGIKYDEVGNASTPHVMEFTLSDTIPPSEMGDFGIEVTGEEPDPI
jgi:hypothetical protein